MAFKLSVILLILVGAVLALGGRETPGGPFAEMPGAAPHEVLLAVAPLETPQKTPPVKPQAPSSVRPLAPPAIPENRVSRDAPAPVAVLPAPVPVPVPVPVPSSEPAPETRAPTPEPATQTAPEPAPDTAKDLAEITGSSVNMRAGPSTDNAILGRAQRGDVVEWLSTPTEGWAIIRHPALDGDAYISSQFLQRLPQ